MSRQPGGGRGPFPETHSQQEAPAGRIPDFTSWLTSKGESQAQPASHQRANVLLTGSGEAGGGGEWGGWGGGN